MIYRRGRLSSVRKHQLWLTLGGFPTISRRQELTWYRKICYLRKKTWKMEQCLKSHESHFQSFVFAGVKNAELRGTLVKRGFSRIAYYPIFWKRSFACLLVHLE